MVFGKVSVVMLVVGWLLALSMVDLVSGAFYLYRHIYSTETCSSWARTVGVEEGVCVADMNLLYELLNLPVNDPILACDGCRGFMYNSTSAGKGL